MTKTEDRRVFINTNVLLAASDADRLHHADARAFLDAAFIGSWRVFASPQIFREYLVVATRPTKNNGLGLLPEDPLRMSESFSKNDKIIYPQREAYCKCYK